MDSPQQQSIGQREVPKVVSQFKLENKYNHFHLSAISSDGKVFVTTTGITSSVADKIWIVDIPSEQKYHEMLAEKLSEGQKEDPLVIQPRKIISERGFILGLHVSPNGKFLSCCVRNYTAPDAIVPISPELDESFHHPPVVNDVSTQLYDLESGEFIATLDGCVGMSEVDRIFLILPQFSPCSNFVCAGSEDGSVRIWSTKFGIPVATLEAHTDVVNFCAWHPKLPIIVSGS
eukprot:CAMPEP_0206191542 /NCGR_PEP_ID=MMETSP0166-20121206/5426_1 /ASSEMBLY_ACC=CAM_ASM_000260 /TAXON_ID=95228 /ORGANISM="Vannella robusta, Strain DIVA3 518/3/11/1/6" /LENGTH=231 /DNA_ID=CAMNT_0053607869 /DNA_START=714 /DNA_END=1405 /DNA_ORIENTATION=+